MIDKKAIFHGVVHEIQWSTDYGGSTRCDQSFLWTGLISLSMGEQRDYGDFNAIRPQNDEPVTCLYCLGA